jgi:L-alanine-DL-glutamate epimerase-like enolase superfamily enzyme
MSLTVSAAIETWPIAGEFTISRGSRTEMTVVVAKISDGKHVGRGECAPYPRYDETPEGVVAAISAARLGDKPDRQALRQAQPAGAARNALDCALWDLEAKHGGISVAERCGYAALKPVTTAYTLSLGTPEAMNEAARRAAHYPLLKVKLGGDGDAARIAAVRAAAPDARLIVDANEAWSDENFIENITACADASVALVEQPLSAGKDDQLAQVAHAVSVCADESAHVAADLQRLAGKYDAVNIKLDKAGGLTEALDMMREARARGFMVMVGCMVGTSLAMAPGVILAQGADIADLDGPLLLARDREPGLTYTGGLVEPPSTSLWG